MSLRRVNLNLLPVLQALLRHRSVSRAAAAVGMSQSGASEALMQLRSTLNDPLLVRLGGGMALTPRAVELIAATDALCDELEDLFSTRGFDPALSTRVFTVATSDYVVFLLAGPMLAAAEKEAPGISLQFIDADDSLPARMSAREVDLAVIPSIYVDDLAPGQMHLQPLLRETGVALFRTGHPLARLEVLSMADLEAYRTLLFHPASKAIARRNVSLLMGGRAFRTAAHLTQNILPPFLLAGTDYFSITPKRLADRMTALLPLECRPVDFDEPEVEISMVWSKVQDADPGLRWFRQLLQRCVAELPQPA